MSIELRGRPAGADAVRTRPRRVDLGTAEPGYAALLSLETFWRHAQAFMHKEAGTGFGGTLERRAKSGYASARLDQIQLVMHNAFNIDARGRRENNRDD
jgi:hypothetical protein